MIRVTTLSATLALTVAVSTLVACSTYQPIDSEKILEEDFETRVAPELRSILIVPYQLDEEVLESIKGRVNPAASERRRSDAIQDFIFGSLDLQYSLTPTRDAVQTYHAAQGNCLSFVNLFVGIGREMRLNPFYVEVEDYQRWNYQDGVVVSRGHIVAGMYIDGELSTFDFLPYRPKGYKEFKPISDVWATAHYYNNLGAEALMDDRMEEAGQYLDVAYQLSPTFDKAINNLGVVRMRSGDAAGAIELYEQGREMHPEDVPILSNLTRAYQQNGQVEEANVLLDYLEEVNQTNPFFFIYRGDVALSNGDTVTALEYMRRAYTTDTELPEVHVGLARVYLAIGNTERAQHHVERALKLDATHEEARKYAALLIPSSRP